MDDPGVSLPAWPRRIELLRRGAVAVALVAAVTDAVAVGFTSWTVGTFAGLGLAVAGVLLTRRLPVVGLAMTFAGFALTVGVGADPTATWSIVVFTLFAGTCRGVPAFAAGAVVSGALFAVLAVTEMDGAASPAAVAAPLSAVAAAAIGGGLRAQGRYWTALEQRASAALAARDRAAERDLAEERLRIAQDLHDLVGHEVAALNIHIGVAEVSLPADADQSRDALGHARSAVQSVLRETQQILTVLRRADSDGSDRQPTPGLEGVPGLVESYRRIGLVVHLLSEQPRVDVEPAVGVAAYRVVQEALTNAHRHGDGRASLTIIRTGDLLSLTLTNAPGQKLIARQADSSLGRGGYGLVGMRERVESVGGQLTVANTGGQFEVVARLPLLGGGA